MPTIKELKVKAKQLGMNNSTKLSKRELVWSIQKAEGYDQCYERIAECTQEDCWFRSDCVGR